MAEAPSTVLPFGKLLLIEFRPRIIKYNCNLRMAEAPSVIRKTIHLNPTSMQATTKSNEAPSVIGGHDHNVLKL